MKDPVNGINRDENAKAIGFQRAISIWRTAYSTVTQSRNSFPDAVGAVTWIAQYAPHFSSFVPVYASVDKTPTSLNVGTQYKLDRSANWWVHCVTGNYLSRWYSFAIDDVRQLQKGLENWMVSRQVESEQKAVKALTAASTPSAVSEALRSTIGTFHEEASAHVLSTWWSFFDDMVGKYRDIYKVVNPHAENFINSVQYLTVPKVKLVELIKSVSDCYCYCYCYLAFDICHFEFIFRVFFLCLLISFAISSLRYIQVHI